MMREIAKSILNAAVNFAIKTRLGRYCLEQSIASLMTSTCAIMHQGHELRFAAPNRLNRFRINTFATKEPETLEWIEAIPRGSVMWDIGANVGLYTCYAAKARGCRVFAFEPSVFNLELLARNISLNKISSRATIVPLPLSEFMMISSLNMTTTEWGGAMSTFDQPYTHDGTLMQKAFEYSTIGLTLDEAVRLLKLPQPDFIKMDVDGIEHLILKGGSATLASIRGILIEINDEFKQQSEEASRYLSDAGLILKEKRHAELFEGSAYRHSYNQIWVRQH